MAVEFIASSKLPTQWGEFRLFAFQNQEDEKEHLALVLGDVNPGEPILCRVHSECLTGDALFSLRCDCGSQLQTAMQNIAIEERGIILYLRQEGRSIGLLNKIKAYELQDRGDDTVEANEKLGFEADERNYDICGDIFRHFGINKIKLMTNNPGKVEALENLGVKVVARIPIHTGKNPHNEHYLETKTDKLGHIPDSS